MQNKISYIKRAVRSLKTGCIFCVLLTLTACTGEDINIETVKETEAVPEEMTSEETTRNDPGTIYVYVCGAVENEGVYELSSDSRVTDALDMAGGYREDAFRGYVNLAEKLSDGQRIYIPTEQEVEKNEIVISTGTGDDASKDDNGLIDINKADKEALTTLSGIGDSRAEDIIAYRESSGGFGTIEDIKNVSGIGEATFDRIKDRITVN
ncbi:MAG: helix-hairpin-helix domain-containing protein [Eubacterium sp.]|nr:helix-hairpin-helix domain-containing protein [Eubacterium sp.]